MTAHYKTIQRRQDVGMRISALYRQQQLSIGILDVSGADTLKACIDWFIENMNCLVHVITLEDTFENEDLGTLYPDVTFICFSSLVSTGEMINAFADECYATYFLVARSDIQILGFDGSQLIHLMSDRSHPAVITPVMLNQDYEVLPTIRVPHLSEKEIEPLSFMPDITPGKNTKNLYPVMGLGLYDRALFQRLRGYDEAITGEFWQLFDFGSRCHLYGFSLMTCADFAIRFLTKHSVIEDLSQCEGMNRAYTKALSVHRIAGKNVIEKWKPYVDKELLKTEVKTKQIILQKTDFFTLMNEWKSPETDE